MATLVTFGLTLVAGLPFRIAVVLGSLSGILNVIPYIGSITSALTGILIGVLMNINGLGNTSDVWMVVITMACVYAGAQTVDAAVLQPFIYSKSVRTHPLEIFLVILIAGSIGGILGMLVAIPAYTVARVFAKQFFNQFRVVQKLTEKI
ncbi:MAG: AI-2E family transporter, partial [Prevotellaceae bacterium]|jgi:predicted PurR-regulated permease PerM|nr:AI-2E family transporter [Prevotellaceae bacterium]